MPCEEGALRLGAWARRTRLSAPTGLELWSPATPRWWGASSSSSQAPQQPHCGSTVVPGQDGGGTTVFVQADPTPAPGCHWASMAPAESRFAERPRPRVLMTFPGSCATLLRYKPRCWGSRGAQSSDGGWAAECHPGRRHGAGGHSHTGPGSAEGGSSVLRGEAGQGGA